MAMKSLHIHFHLFLNLRRSLPLSTPKFHFSSNSNSFTKTPYPYQYDLIISRPANPPKPSFRTRKPKPISSLPKPESNFDDWVTNKLSNPNSNTNTNNNSNTNNNDSDSDSDSNVEMDKGKRKYYNKRRKRMYGEEMEEESGGKCGDSGELIELKQEVVELGSLHKRQEELYFYDAFAYPWEKDKHYKMVYQMEKKFFPDQGFDKAFLEPGKGNVGKTRASKKDVGSERDRGLVFFDEKEKEKEKEVEVGEVTEKRVGDFFKCLKKFGDGSGSGEVESVEPFFSSRSVGLPPKWDGPFGTVVLVNKPKGWTSFTVCGKLRRLVNVKKVGHAGTLDPMATGLLIVCVGKATKQVDRYQGMIKGYSGIFRLGEATSTLDADSPVIQRESWEHIKDVDIKKAAASFVGEISQVPPMFSAIKVGGERMYEKARKGETMELAPRRISIFQFDVERSLDDRQNVIFRTTCSKGTYIRSLCADFGKALGSCAHLTALRRDSIGEYSADDAWEFKELEEQITKGYM